LFKVNQWIYFNSLSCSSILLYFIKFILRSWISFEFKIPAFNCGIETWTKYLLYITLSLLILVEAKVSICNTEGSYRILMSLSLKRICISKSTLIFFNGAYMIENSWYWIWIWRDAWTKSLKSIQNAQILLLSSYLTGCRTNDADSIAIFLYSLRTSYNLSIWSYRLFLTCLGHVWYRLVLNCTTHCHNRTSLVCFELVNNNSLNSVAIIIIIISHAFLLWRSVIIFLLALCVNLVILQRRSKTPLTKIFNWSLILSNLLILYLE
jgi:hypothetical protein